MWDVATIMESIEEEIEILEKRMKSYLDGRPVAPQLVQRIKEKQRMETLRG